MNSIQPVKTNVIDNYVILLADDDIDEHFLWNLRLEKLAQIKN
jgi:hypothetical protein